MAQKQHEAMHCCATDLHCGIASLSHALCFYFYLYFYFYYFYFYFYIYLYLWFYFYF